MCLAFLSISEVWHLEHPGGLPNHLWFGAGPRPSLPGVTRPRQSELVGGRELSGVSVAVKRFCDQPWRCLCRGFELQITMTRPWRRITLQLSQMGFTLGLTFMSLFRV